MKQKTNQRRSIHFLVSRPEPTKVLEISGIKLINQSNTLYPNNLAEALKGGGSLISPAFNPPRGALIVEVDINDEIKATVKRKSSDGEQVTITVLREPTPTLVLVSVMEWLENHISSADNDSSTTSAETRAEA